MLQLPIQTPILMPNRHFPFLTAAALLFMLAGSAYAQKQATILDISVANGPVATTDTRGDLQLIRHFSDSDLDSPYLGGAEAGGFIFGTNGYGDTAKSVALQYPGGSGRIWQVNAYAVRSETTIMTEFNVGVFTGDEFSGPVSPLYSQTHAITDIDAVISGGSAPLQATEFILDEPVDVGSTFHIVFYWSPNYGDEDLGFWSTDELPFHSPYEWEEYLDKWWEVASNWSSNGWHVFIEALVGPAVSNEDDGEQQAVFISSIHPNPAIGTSFFTLEIPTVQDVTVEVFNLLGQRVSTVFDGTLAPGRMLFDVDTSNLTAGMYIVRVLGDNGISQTRRFVVAN